MIRERIWQSYYLPFQPSSPSRTDRVSIARFQSSFFENRMRIIHTSDWHLGQYFYGKSRAAEHQQFAQWLVDQVETHQVDAVIVAGDIFDTGAPPSYARQLYADMLSQLHDAGCVSVVLAGNHDSVAVLNETAGLLHRFHSQVTTAVSENPADQVSVLRAQNGDPLAILCAVPFIRPRDIVRSEAGLSASQRQQNLQNAIVAHYQSLHEYALDLRERAHPGLPIIATGHLTAVGAKSSESVRDIYIGTLEALPVSAFPAADYVALGHIHRAQSLGDTKHVRYSGSPIPLSFDELNQSKSVALVEFDGAKLGSVEKLEIPSFQALFTLKGTHQSVLEQLEKISDEIGDDETAWLSIEITEGDYPPDARRAIEATAAELPVEVLLHRHQRKHAQLTNSEPQHAQLHELTPSEVFEQRLDAEALEDQQRLSEIRHCFNEVLEELELKQSDPEPAPKRPDLAEQGELW